MNIPRSHNRLKISTARISTYRSAEPFHRTEESLKKSLANLSFSEYNGNISAKAKALIRNRMENWLGSVEYHFADRKEFLKKIDLCFTLVTLTLPCTQNHSDNEIKKKILTPFIESLKRKYRIRHNFWVAETGKNDNIHFHLIIDRRIDWKKLRDLWNLHLKPFGYIEDYRHAQEFKHKDGFRYIKSSGSFRSYSKQLAAYKVGIKTNWSSPNSTDIAKLRRVKNAQAYVIKYVTKNDNGRKIEGRLWGCSDSLKDLDSYDIDLSEVCRQELMVLAECDGSRLFESDFCYCVYRFNSEELFRTSSVLNQIYMNFIRHCLLQLYPKVLDPLFFNSQAQKFDQLNLVIPNRIAA